MHAGKETSRDEAGDHSRLRRLRSADDVGRARARSGSGRASGEGAGGRRQPCGLPPAGRHLSDASRPRQRPGARARRGSRRHGGGGRFVRGRRPGLRARRGGRLCRVRGPRRRARGFPPRSLDLCRRGGGHRGLLHRERDHLRARRARRRPGDPRPCGRERGRHRGSPDGEAGRSHRPFHGGSRHKVDRVLALGADHGILYKTEDFVEEVFRITRARASTWSRTSSARTTSPATSRY